MAQNATLDDLRRRVVALNGGHVGRRDVPGGDEMPMTRLSLAPVAAGYANAQIDDYGGRGGAFRHAPGLTLDLRARFSHDAARLRGTAGFGFWNAPYGDRSRRRPALPQAVWFFFASPPNDLPFALEPDGRGWFAATLDAGARSALGLIPLAPAVLALNQFTPLRRRLWPGVRWRLGISAAPLAVDLRDWHDYRLAWRANGCRFFVDDRPVLATPHSPRGPLGFVCWFDNQYLVFTSRGRVRAGVLPITAEQWLEVAGLTMTPLTD